VTPRRYDRMNQIATARVKRVQLALGVALLLGSIVMIRANARIVHAGYSPASTFSSYSYEAGCSTAVDTITIVFTNGSGSYDDAYQHGQYSDHGEFDTHEAQGDQYFQDDYGCSTNDDGAATASGRSNDRWHFRDEVAATTAYSQSYAATPHYDEWEWDIWPFTGHHCVDTYGFTNGRAYVYDHFTSASDGHSGNQSNYWGNTMAIAKCHGEYAYTNGHV